MRRHESRVCCRMRWASLPLLKWAFAFWVGQLAAVGGIVTVLLRNGPPR
jgi:hypothetical protein